MKIIKKIDLLRKDLSPLKLKGRTIGFVPTMGALHNGHLSLVKCAKKENDVVVVSIFVNPAQFSPHEDFKKYPRDLKKDAKALSGFCDFIFAPSVDELYPDGFSSFVEIKGLNDRLCGQSRKGHFRGVATVVTKLLNIVMPQRAYFGQKDAQQAVLIKKMTTDLNFPVKISVLPIIREPDGLAMSSRNVYLSAKERMDAVVLFQAIKSAERLAAQGMRDSGKIVKVLTDFISRKSSACIDYVEIVDPDELEPVKAIERKALLLLAVYIGRTRLIDNTVLRIK